MKTYTLDIWGFAMEVSADVDPGEPMTFDHPGAAPMADVIHVHVGGVDIVEMLSKAQIDRIEEHILRQVS